MATTQRRPGTPTAKGGPGHRLHLLLATLSQLEHGRSVVKIAEAIGVSAQTVCRDMAAICKTRIIEAEGEGQRVLYRLARKQARR